MAEIPEKELIYAFAADVTEILMAAFVPWLEANRGKHGPLEVMMGVGQFVEKALAAMAVAAHLPVDAEAEWYVDWQRAVTQGLRRQAQVMEAYLRRDQPAGGPSRESRSL